MRAAIVWGVVVGAIQAPQGSASTPSSGSPSSVVHRASAEPVPKDRVR
jgi:hypothetical protein